MKKRLLLFGSGDKTGGCSGIQKIAEYRDMDYLDFDLAGIVSNHPEGGGKQKADQFGLPFYYFPGPFGEKYKQELEMQYRELVEKSRADFVALSGWLKQVYGLKVGKTFNIHPGPLPETAGRYGHYVHERVHELFLAGEIRESAVTMHFVDERYDTGPVFFRYPFRLYETDKPETIAQRANAIEHNFQWWITSLVVSGQIYCEGQALPRVYVPDWYPFMPRLAA